MVLRVPPEDHVPYYKFIIIHHTTTHGPHLDRHPVPHQISIHSKDLGNKLPNPTYRHGTDGKAHMNEGGRLTPTPQSIPREKSHTHALHAHRRVVAPAG